MNDGLTSLRPGKEIFLSIKEMGCSGVARIVNNIPADSKLVIVWLEDPFAPAPLKSDKWSIDQNGRWIVNYKDISSCRLKN